MAKLWPTLSFRDGHTDKESYVSHFLQKGLASGIPVVEVIPKSACSNTHVATFPITSPFCLIGSSEDCDIRVKVAEVKPVHCQLQVLSGEEKEEAVTNNEEMFERDEETMREQHETVEKEEKLGREQLEIKRTELEQLKKIELERLKAEEEKKRIDEERIKQAELEDEDRLKEVEEERIQQAEREEEDRQIEVEEEIIQQEEREEEDRPIEDEEETIKQAELEEEDRQIEVEEGRIQKAAQEKEDRQIEVEEERIQQAEREKADGQIEVEEDGQIEVEEERIQQAERVKEKRKRRITEEQRRNKTERQQIQTSYGDKESTVSQEEKNVSLNCSGVTEMDADDDYIDCSEMDEDIMSSEHDDSAADMDYKDDESECETDDTDYDTDESASETDESGNDKEIKDTDMAPESDNETVNSAVFPQLTSEKLLTVQLSKKNSSGNLDNKKHSCLYCEKLYANIARHLELVHKEEQDVAKILIMPKKSRDRRIAWQKLVNKGDFAHNYRIYEQGYGMVIPKYRSKKPDPNSYLPCQFCQGLYKKPDMWKHQKSCNEKSNSKVKYGPVKSGKLLMPMFTASKSLFENVIVKMKDDDVKRAVVSDSTIILFANSQYSKQGHIEQNRSYLSNRMRELGRLLIASKKLDSNIKSVLDLMKNKNWDLLISAVKLVANFDGETHRFGIPSLADKLGQNMKNCAETLRFEALKNNDAELILLTDTFAELYRLGWSKSVSTAALNTLKENKYNKPLLLPLAEDVMQLNNYLDQRAKQLCADIHSNPDNYSKLANVCLASIIMFNRKRSGEAQRMTLEQFLNAKKGEVRDPIMKSLLSEFEQKLCFSHLHVEIKGKKQRKVPVLLTEKMVTSIKTLVKFREAAGVKTSKFLFARPGSSEHPYRGCDALRQLAEECPSCKHPETMTSTALRKQLATLAQVLNLREFEQDLLATFQGHDIRVHRQFYRLPESTLQVAKISKILHCINSGTIQKYHGCNFDEIEFQENEPVEDETDEDTDHDGANSDQDENSEKVVSPSLNNVRKSKQRITGSERQPWTSEEKRALETHFSRFIHLGKVPGKIDVLNVCRKEKLLAHYDWKKVKYGIYNIILSRKRKTRFTI